MKYLEVCVYGLLNLSYLVLAIFPFWDRLRYSKKTTFSFIGLFGLVQIFFAMWAGLWVNEDYRGVISGVALLVYLGLFALIIKAHIGKKLFMLIMLINISSFINIAGKYFENLLFGEVAWEKTYAFSYSLCVVILQILILVPVGFSIFKLFKNAIENELVRIGRDAVPSLVDSLQVVKGRTRGIVAMVLIRIGESSIDYLQKAAETNSDFEWIANYLITEIKQLP